MLFFFLKWAIGFALIILLKRNCLFIITLILEGRTVIIIITVIVFILILILLLLLIIIIIIIVIIIIIIVVVVLIIIINIIINYYLPPAKTFALAVPKVEQATRTGMIQAITPYKRLAKICWDNKTASGSLGLEAFQRVWGLAMSGLQLQSQ